MMLPGGLRIHLGIVFLSAFLPYATAQQGGIGGSAGNTGDSGRRVAPQRPQYPSAQPPNQAARSTGIPIFLSGVVVLEDGSPPPFGAVIEMDCAGLVSREGDVGLNGLFSFQVGGENDYSQGFPDASRRFDPTRGDWDSFGRINAPSAGSEQALRARRLLGCELQARMHGYRSTRISLNQVPNAGRNEVGTIILYPYARVQGNSVSLSTLRAPKGAKKSLGHALKEIRKEKFAEAEESLRSAVRVYPKYAEAWFLLGAVCERGGRADEAKGHYYESLKADPMYVKPYIRLAKLAAIGKRWREAADLSEKLLVLDPVTLPECYYMSALAHLNLNELELAQQRAEQGQRLDFSYRFPQFCLILANVFDLKRDSANAVRELRDYLKIAPNASNSAAVRAHLQRMESQSQAGQ